MMYRDINGYYLYQMLPRIGIAFMYVGIRICRDLWYDHEWLLVFVIGLCFVFMAIKQLMEL